VYASACKIHLPRDESTPRRCQSPGQSRAPQGRKVASWGAPCRTSSRQACGRARPADRSAPRRNVAFRTRTTWPRRGKGYSTENLRTVALLGHGSAGKTTLAEALLGARRDSGSGQCRERHHGSATLTVWRRPSAFAAAPRAATWIFPRRVCTCSTRPDSRTSSARVDRRARRGGDAAICRQCAERDRDDHLRA